MYLIQFQHPVVSLFYCTRILTLHTISNAISLFQLTINIHPEYCNTLLTGLLAFYTFPPTAVYSPHSSLPKQKLDHAVLLNTTFQWLSILQIMATRSYVTCALITSLGSSSTAVSFTYSAPATLNSWLCPENAKHLPTSGPLHRLFPLSQRLFSRGPCSSLAHIFQVNTFSITTFLSSIEKSLVQILPHPNSHCLPFLLSFSPSLISPPVITISQF